MFFIHDKFYKYTFQRVVSFKIHKYIYLNTHYRNYLVKYVYEKKVGVTDYFKTDNMSNIIQTISMFVKYMRIRSTSKNHS